MPELQRLHPDHEGAVLAFETANRGYFAASISDRGDEFFENYPQRHHELLAEQQAGRRASYVLVDADDGAVVARFNLVFVDEGVAEVGYRVAQRVAGRGVATAGLSELCRLAASAHGLKTLRAATSSENLASQKVLLKAGFVHVGPADPSEIGGKEGSWYQRDLADESE